MKKIAICAAITAICAAPMMASASADMYGHLRLSLNSIDADVGPTGTDGLTVADNTSLFGFKASSEGDGIKAFVHMQTGANADGGGTAFASRFYFGGLKGDFGTVAYGRMTNAYKMPGFKMDPFYNHMSVVASPVAAGANAGANQVSGGGATFGLSGASNGFTDNALQYTSNKIGDIKINVGLYIDDSNADDHGMGFGAEYNKAGVKAGIQFASNDTTAQTVPGIAADGDAMRLYGSYTSGPMTVAASYETVDVSATLDVDYIFLVGKFKVSDKTRVAATIGMVGDGGQEGTGITAGVFQSVAPKTELFASMSQVSADVTGQVEPSVMSVGAIHKF